MKKQQKCCSSNSPRLSLSISTGKQPKGKSLSMWFPFHNPSPHERKRRVELSTDFGNQGNEKIKIKILVFFISNMNVKHIIKIIIIFIIRLICSVHHCTWTPPLQE